MNSIARSLCSSTPFLGRSLISSNRPVFAALTVRNYAATPRSARKRSSPNKFSSSGSRFPKKSKFTKDTLERLPATTSKNDSPGKQVFQSGKFSQLHSPSKAVYDKSSTGIDSITTFDQLRIFPTVRAAMIEEIKSTYNLKGPKYKNKEELTLKPSPIQVAAIRKINQPRLKNVNRKKLENVSTSAADQINEEFKKLNALQKLKVFTLAAETGSGKTWAYLASMLSKLKEDDFALYEQSPERYDAAKSAQTVRSIILLPTHDLVEQVYATLERANNVKFDVEKIGSHSNFKEFLSLPDQGSSLNLNILKWGSGDPHTKLFDKCLKGRVDVLVTTPGKISSLSKLQNINRPYRFFNAVEYCVLDEADTLMDQSWIETTMPVVTRLAKLKDLIICSATIPKSFQATLNKLFPADDSIINIVTPSLHKLPKQVKISVIDAELSPYNGSKTRALAQALYAIMRDGTEADHVKRVVVFVNKKESVSALVETLVKKYGHREQDVIGITGEDKPAERTEKLSPFMKPAVLLEDDLDNSKIKVLVTSDLLARGMNFVAIKNVIIMDIPRSSVDLVHRIGRTGRMNQSGRVILIVDKRKNKTWLSGLPNAVKRGLTMG
ncbi:ATP-dependent RNA helicase MRH4, mitochondrial [Scheffersomyces xylosifermentans]|uniref:ATP-dependent RNA helicase MRH4, mitochondrial n=1 Tax=Scheffersomyces xylosifermentans TaxID=1304137 RepID=UPI00315C60B6